MREKSYRLHFEKKFDWLEFNSLLVEESCSDEIIIGFDSSYISKSNKNTPGLGYLYSGVANKYKKVLEIGNISAIDVKQNMPYQLKAIQSPKSKKDNLCSDDKSLIDNYAKLIINRSESLEKISKTLVVDGYFAKS